MNRHNMPGVIAVAIVTLCTGSVVAADAGESIYAEAVAADTRLPGTTNATPAASPP